METKKSILITGASTGIGKECALYFDKMGFMVFAGVRKEDDKQILQKEGSDRLTPIILDVTKEETISSAVETISNETEYSFWGLVNNAGIGISGVLEATPTTELRKLLEVNVIGLHAVTKAFLPLIRKNKGRIVNIGSVASFMVGPGSSSYAASKFAVRAISDSLRMELKPFGIFVSLVAPGATESEIWDKSKEYKEKLRENTSLELAETYNIFIKAGDNLVKYMKPMPAIEVVKAVKHGLMAKKPKVLYIVGNDAKKGYKLSKLPNKISDWLVIKHLIRISRKSFS